MPFELGIVIGILTIVFFAVLGRATFGFGEALVSMPVLVLLVGLDIARPYIAILSIFNGVAILAGHFRHLKFRSALPLVFAAAFGIAVAFWLLDDMKAYEAAVKATLGVIIICFSLFKLIGPERLHLNSDRTALAFGFVAGVLAGAYNTPGPPIVVYGTMRRWTADQFRATFQGFALPCTSIVVIGHAIKGTITQPVLWLVVASLPVCIVAILLGRWLSRKITENRFSQILYILLLGMGLFLVINSLLPSNNSEEKDSQPSTSTKQTATLD